MDKGANLSSIGELCFCVAYDNKNTEIMDMLVANGVNPDIKNKVYINQQLYTLIRSESIKTKKILAILNSCACYNHSEITKILIERGANIDHVNKQDRTPILQALIYNSNETAKILVENGANISGITGVDYLNTAIANKNKINVDLLINAGVDINDSTESTPLQTAVNQSHVPIIKKLLEKGANPNLKTEKENYPLAIAIKKGHEFITHLLLLHGADANLPFDKKSSIKDLAAKSKNQAIASMVQLDKEELKKFKPRQKLLRFTNKRMLFADRKCGK